VLVGPSGCGKSTLLAWWRVSRPFRPARSASAIASSTTSSRPNATFAMVFQNYALYPHIAGLRQHAYGLRNRKTPKDEIDRLVREAARILEIDALLDRKPRQLSGRQRQRVAMGARDRAPARRRSCSTKPLSNLDAKLRVSTRVEIKKLQKSLGTTSLYVTHDQLEAMTLGRHAGGDDSGKVDQIGARPLEVYQKPPTTFVATFIGAPAMNLFAMSARGAGPAAGRCSHSAEGCHHRHPPGRP